MSTRRQMMTVTIGGERGGSWEKILGTRTLPVTSPLPVHADLPGHPNAQVYMVAIDLLPEGALDKIVQAIAAKFDLDAASVRADIARDGIPILADKDVSGVAMDVRLFL